MAIFNRLFTELVKLKSKKAYVMALVQLVAVVVFSIFTFDNKGYLMHTPRHTFIGNIDLTYFFSGLLAIYLIFSLVFIFIFYMLTCIENERINRNQTWRLTPISDAYFYLDNVLTSVAATFFYVFLNLVTSILLYGITLLLDNSFRTGLGDIFSAIRRYGIPGEAIVNFLGMLVLLVLTAGLIYFIISFLNFSSQAILDFLPDFSSQAIIKSIHLFLIILIAWILIRAYNYVMTIIASPIDFFLGNGSNTSQEIGISILIMLALDLVFLLVNTFLFSKFFEGQEKK